MRFGHSVRFPLASHVRGGWGGFGGRGVGVGGILLLAKIVGKVQVFTVY